MPGRRFLLTTLLLVASPAHAEIDCRQALETAGFKREVAFRCGYFVNTGEVEQRAKACIRRVNPGFASLAGRVGGQQFTALRERMGLQAACRDVLRRMRAGFVAD